jgi:hypothetical protein
MAVTQQRAGQPALLFEGNTLWRQRNAFNEVKPSEDARNMQCL